MNEIIASAVAFSAQNCIEFLNPALLGSALTHRSYLNEHPEVDSDDNERLEYLGDAVLDFLIAARLFRQFPAAREGELTRLRAALVRRETLARFAHTLHLGEHLLMGHGEIETGGRERPALLCAAFEALVGALYLDRGLDAVAEVVIPLVDLEIPGDAPELVDKDPKSQLQELAQGTLGLTPHYRTIGAEGPEHAKQFRVEVMVGELIGGAGRGGSKQAAAKAAASDALEHPQRWITSADIGA